MYITVICPHFKFSWNYHEYANNTVVTKRLFSKVVLLLRKCWLNCCCYYYSALFAATKNNTTSSFEFTAAGMLPQRSPLRHPYKALASHLTAWWWVTASQIPRHQCWPARRKGRFTLRCQLAGSGHLFWMIWHRPRLCSHEQITASLLFDDGSFAFLIPLLTDKAVQSNPKDIIFNPGRSYCGCSNGWRLQWRQW